MDILKEKPYIKKIITVLLCIGIICGIGVLGIDLYV